MLPTRNFAFLLLVFSVLCSGCAGETGSSESDAANETTESTDAGDVADSSDNEETKTEEETDTLAPEAVKLTNANWEDVLANVAKHDGKVVVLDVWSTSCPPCLREFPNLVKLSETYPDEVVCLSLNTDYFGSSSKPPEYYEESVRKVLSGMNATFDNYLCTLPSDELYEKIELASIPAVYVFGPDGEVAERFDNDEQKYGEEFTYADHIIPKIESLLKPAE